jgi:hypothetical protein
MADGSKLRAAIVRRDDAKAPLDEQGHDAAPFPPRLREAVQEHHRPRSGAGGDDMQAQARFDLGHLVAGVRRRWGDGHGDPPNG